MSVAARVAQEMDVKLGHEVTSAFSPWRSILLACFNMQHYHYLISFSMSLFKKHYVY